MAPRGFWKGYLKLSLVTCPVAMTPATSQSDKVRFHTLNRATGHRIESRYVDAESGKPVAEEDEVKGYPRGEDDYVMLEDEDIVNAQRPEGGRRTFELTDAGREAVAALPEAKPWEQAGEDVGDDAVALHDLVHRVLGATRQVLQAGSPEQVKAAQEVLREARKSLYKILADD